MKKILSLLLGTAIMSMPVMAMDSELSDNESVSTRAPSMKITPIEEKDLEECTTTLPLEKREKIRKKIRTYFLKQYKVLELDHAHLTIEDVQKNILDFLKRNPLIEGINLSFNPIALDKDIKFLDSIRIIAFQGNNLNENSIQYLLKNNKIQQLVISDNPIGNKGLFFISKLQSLELLSAENCGLTDEGIKNFHSENLKQIALSDEGITEVSIDSLLDNTKLKAIIINSSKITILNIQKIKSHRYLQNLFLDNLKISTNN